VKSESRTIDRLCNILNSFSENETALTLTEISTRIQLPKSTTYRFLKAMQCQGLIADDPEGRGYRPGFQLIHWGMLSQSSLEIRRLALPVLRCLTQVTGETSALSMRFGEIGICVEMVEGTHPIRLALKTGQIFHLHASACAKVLWAHLPEEEIAEILGRIELTPFGKNTITDPAQMRSELKAIRERGYATSMEETDRDVYGIASPVFDNMRNCLAGIGIIVPLIRVTLQSEADWAKTVQAAAAELSQQLGAPVPDFSPSH
jgi:IclR family transcriptional regulator, KDG regulon repressor